MYELMWIRINNDRTVIILETISTSWFGFRKIGLKPYFK